MSHKKAKTSHRCTLRALSPGMCVSEVHVGSLQCGFLFFLSTIILGFVNPASVGM